MIGVDIKIVHQLGKVQSLGLDVPYGPLHGLAHNMVYQYLLVARQILYTVVNVPTITIIISSLTVLQSTKTEIQTNYCCSGPTGSSFAANIHSIADSKQPDLAGDACRVFLFRCRQPDGQRQPWPNLESSRIASLEAYRISLG